MKSAWLEDAPARPARRRARPAAARPARPRPPASSAAGVGARLLLHRDDHGVAAVDPGAAARRLGVERDTGDLPQQDRRAVAGRDHDIAERVRIRRQATRADREFGAALIHGPPPALTPKRGDARSMSATAMSRPAIRAGTRRDPQLPHLAADDHDLRDAGNRRQPRAHRPVGELRSCIGSVGVCRRDVMATSMTSPMIEEIGWICGTTPPAAGRARARAAPPPAGAPQPRRRSSRARH